MNRTLLRALAVTGSLLLAPAVAHAAPARGPAAAPVIARINVPPADIYDLAGGLGAVWLLNPDEFQYSTLRRIDPTTNTITASFRLDSSAGGFAVGDGSIWVSMYFDNQVERLDAHGRVIARIGVGLQPQWTYIAFGSVWVTNHHGRSVSRIDPHTDRVIATLPAGDQHTFRSGPQQMTDDGHYLYLYSSNGTKPFERIDPRTNAVTTFAAPVNCGNIVAIAGSVWTSDCADTVTLQQLDPATGSTRRTVSGVGIAVCGVLPFECPPQPTMTRYRHALWVGFDTAFDDQTRIVSGGTVEELNASTGAIEQQIAVGGDASVLRHAFGDLWLVDDTNGVVTRLHPRHVA